MARSRNIKPSFFSSDQLAECQPLARLLFAGLWTIADREGRLEDRPKKIKIEVLAYDKCDSSALLDELQAAKLINRYSVNGTAYIQILKFTKHQQPHYKEVASVIPPSPQWIDSGKTAGAVTEKVRQKILERDGKCKQCGTNDDLTLDHIKPRSAGGSHDEDNLQTLCRKCNSSKNNSLASTSNIGSMLGQGDCSMPPLTPLTDSLTPHPDSLQEPDIFIFEGNEFNADMLFDVFWGSYPDISTKGNKQEARTKFMKLLENGEDHAKIIDGCRGYAEFCKSEGQYNKHASTFLNPKERRWLGEWEPGRGRPSGLDTNAAALAQGVLSTMRFDGPEGGPRDDDGIQTIPADE